MSILYVGLRKLNLKSIKTTFNIRQLVSKRFSAQVSNPKSRFNKKLVENEAAAEFLKTYKCVYEFNYIKELRLLSRAKLYQTGLSLLFGLSRYN
jgi:hypothetical protein